MMKRVYTQDDVADVVREVVMPCAAPGIIITLTGLLGAGKTTLVRAFLRALGVSGEVTSPTFGYVNTYKTAERTIHHFDLYRLSSPHEFCEAGFEEYLADESALVLIEWPAVIAPVLERYRSVIAISIAYDPDELGHRILTLSRPKS